MEKVASGKFLAMEPVPNCVRANPTPQPRQSKAYCLAFCKKQKAMTSQPAFPLSQKSLAKQNLFGSPIIKETTTRLFFLYLLTVSLLSGI